MKQYWYRAAVHWHSRNSPHTHKESHPWAIFCRRRCCSTKQSQNPQCETERHFVLPLPPANDRICGLPEALASEASEPESVHETPKQSRSSLRGKGRTPRKPSCIAIWDLQPNGRQLKEKVQVKPGQPLVEYLDGFCIYIFPAGSAVW